MSYMIRVKCDDCPFDESAEDANERDDMVSEHRREHRGHHVSWGHDYNAARD